MIKNTYYIGKLTVGKFSTIDLIDERLHNFHLNNDYIESISFDVIQTKYNDSTFNVLIINLYFFEHIYMTFNFSENEKRKIKLVLCDYLYDLIGLNNIKFNFFCL